MGKQILCRTKGLYILEDTGLGFFILFVGFTDAGTFIGPPRLERETRIRDSPVQVPTGTTTGPRE